MDPNLNDLFDLTTVKIPSATPGWNLDAWQYIPTKGAKPCPVIVMAHGLSCNKLMSLAPYAETFAALGHACVVFDYRRWGASDGSPRHCIVVKEQLEDYRTVVKYCRQQAQIDPNRVILWGYSFSGGHAITIASEPELNILAVIAQCPHPSLPTNVVMTSGLVKGGLLGILDWIKQALRLKPIYIPGTALPGKVGMMVGPGTYQTLMEQFPDRSIYPNEISASSAFEILPYKPENKISNVACPILIIAAEDDVQIPIVDIGRLPAKAQKCEYLVIPGGHFDVFKGQSSYEELMRAEIEFLEIYVLL
ncbi:hypothetical protein JAAARDRAFT_68590 [Jaapia argillacea MUCL 33604]|uniref:Xaa-Pro dipeptidyl-peptidase-like domain-containing protein n=1 Tax=Jaapia argillacea MUCL 33604 TaxID=933084 RepID=A0A067PWE5_9AGAM|nr:hypothetical protein JAAARDRAFT_68590 [Jaapia argillacea MUCL 33604]